MNNAEIADKLKPILEQHPNVFLEFDAQGFRVAMNKARPNLLGNFTGGDMAYISNAAAGFTCIVEDRVAETVSLNVECLKRADGEKLLARAQIIRAGNKLIRLRVDVHARNGEREELVAIAQINFSPIHDAPIRKLFG